MQKRKKILHGNIIITTPAKLGRAAVYILTKRHVFKRLFILIKSHFLHEKK